MNKQTFTILFFLTFITGFGQIPTGYYDSAQGLTGYQLKTTLFNIISNGHTPHSYGDLYTAYETTDTDYYYENDGTVLDMYSEKPNQAETYNYHHHNNTCGQYHSEGDCYNREHLLPQSIFNSASPMKSDAHFVVPTDGYVNNRRSSYPFGEVNNPTWTSMNGSKLGTNVTSGYSGTVFEPIDEFKGDIARMMLYVAVRYEDRVASWNNSDMLDGSSEQVFENWFLQLLMNWHRQDPVSQREIDRNNAVYNYQGNRNPFIDHPEYVAWIWDPNASLNAIENTRVVVYPNPVRNKEIHLNYNGNDLIKQVKIFDETGKMVFTRQANDFHTFQLSNLLPGIYLIKIYLNNNAFVVKKLIIE